MLLDENGKVTEGPGFNVFAIRGSHIATPDRGVLEGITRLSVMELAGEAGLTCAAEPLTALETEMRTLEAELTAFLQSAS